MLFFLGEELVTPNWGAKSSEDSHKQLIFSNIIANELENIITNAIIKAVNQIFSKNH